MITRSLAITGGGSISECGSLSHPSRRLVRSII